MTDFRKGERVRVTLEGKVKDSVQFGGVTLYVGSYPDNIVHLTGVVAGRATIERIVDPRLAVLKNAWTERHGITPATEDVEYVLRALDAMKESDRG